MRPLCRFPVAQLFEAVARICCRQNSNSSGRPPAPLGARILTNPEHIFQHNMWDHVQWSEEEKENARQRAIENSAEKIPVEKQGKFDLDASKYWDGFYEMHHSKFFKDRKWLFNEFPELLATGVTSGGHVDDHPAASACPPEPSISSGGQGGGQRNWELEFKQGKVAEGQLAEEADYPGHQAAFRIFEIGCGAGNSVFPIIRSVGGTATFLYCCDFSPRAVRLVEEHPAYDRRVCHAFVHDVRDTDVALPFPLGSLDVVLLVFVLSSVHPARMEGVVNRLAQFLKPGGMLLFRDYGRYDLSQLRFKKGHCLSENFYLRGDGTCVYFFTKDEVHHLFSNAGLEEVQNLEDRRLQVNRNKKVVMRRMWMQAKFRKPL